MLIKNYVVNNDAIAKWFCLYLPRRIAPFLVSIYPIVLRTYVYILYIIIPFSYTQEGTLNERLIAFIVHRKKSFNLPKIEFYA